MKQGLKAILIGLALMMLTIGCFALESTLGIRAGVSYPQVLELSQDKDYNAMFGVTYEAWLMRWMSLGIYPYITRLSAGKDATDTEKFFLAGSYQSNLVGADLQLRLRPYMKGTNIVFNPDFFINRIAPYATVGVGIVNFFPENSDGHRLWGTPDNDFSYTAMTLPAWGLGLTFMTKYAVDFDLGFQKEEVSSDYLDSKERGKNDAYWTAFLGISHTFGKKSARPRYEFVKEAPLVLEGITFEFDSATLTPEAKPILDDVAASLMYYPEVEVEIQGHTDNVGDDTYNLNLSRRRAEAVKDYLVAKGIRGYRLTTLGMGEAKPVASNDTEAGRAMNRRIEFIKIR